MRRIPFTIRGTVLVLALAAGSLAVLSGPTPEAHANDIGGCSTCPALPRIHVSQPYASSPGSLEIWGSGFTPGSTVAISVSQVLNLSQGLVEPIQYLTTTANYYGQIDTWTYLDPHIWCTLYGVPLSNFGYTSGLVIFAQDGTTGRYSNNVSVGIC